MVRHGGWLVFFLTLTWTAWARAQGSGTAHTPTVNSADNQDAVTMAALIAKGNRERQLGRFPEAAQAWSDALALGDDPLTGGRLGVLLVKFGDATLAAGYLLDALDRATSATRQERIEFLDAYDRARKLTCRVTINVSHAHAKISFDGELKQDDGITSFTMFVKPGKHELRATLDGFNDAVASFDAEKGTEMTVPLNFVPKVDELPDLPPPSKSLSVYRNMPAMQWSSNVATDPNYSTKEDPFYEPPKPAPKKVETWPRFSVSGGLVALSGIASWRPALGPVIGVGMYVNKYFSIGLEGRAAWLTTEIVDGYGLNAKTLAGLASVCGHFRWLFGCAVGHVGQIVIDAPSQIYDVNYLSIIQPGFGARLGARIPIVGSFFVRPSFEVVRLLYHMRVGVGRFPLVDQVPWLVGAQLMGEWRF